jgi:UDP-3-O-[3-hydroxymyristoyl] glucosamine N-acyltransferase
LKFPIKPTNVTEFSGRILGEDNTTVSYVSNLDHADMDCLTFCDENHINHIAEVRAGIVLCPADNESTITGFKAASIVLIENPIFEFASHLSRNGYNNKLEGNFAAAFSSDMQSVPELVYIEKNVKIGENFELFPFTSIFSGTTIGNNCRIQSGSSIGAVGLGYAQRKETYHPIPHLGGVVIADNVDIGVNVTVVKGILQNTIIGKGTKIGNNVNIAHNVIIGKNCFISSGAVISGSVEIEDECWVAPNVSILNGVTIRRGGQIGIGSVVFKSTKKNFVYMGNPAKPVWKRKKRPDGESP